jgi:hypothetical protein
MQRQDKMLEGLGQEIRDHVELETQEKSARLPAWRSSI